MTPRAWYRSNFEDSNTLQYDRKDRRSFAWRAARFTNAAMTVAKWSLDVISTSLRVNGSSWYSLPTWGQGVTAMATVTADTSISQGSAQRTARGRRVADLP